MIELFVKNGRLMVLMIALLIVSGLASVHSLPRAEDPTMVNLSMKEDDYQELQSCRGYEERTIVFFKLITFLIYFTNEIICSYYISKQRALKYAKNPKSIFLPPQ